MATASFFRIQRLTNWDTQRLLIGSRTAKRGRATSLVRAPLTSEGKGGWLVAAAAAAAHVGMAEGNCEQATRRQLRHRVGSLADRREGFEKSTGSRLMSHDRAIRGGTDEMSWLL
ncbi:hypothetical protein SODALDRAFT_181321 [Sodiomyces alkalinus F11]|uniref:Uncharacterized protein n=1 Tax=Sodiomyces alkalinus (strain CBS 110278 / VKM F-3762 / F11) TaxID=1314773 RepID=A0A3N2PUR8_SODAK|nr:hypothetical protein SODALDRAFT_181321 [Sodiomyces alkalinus F11]ROT38086.1 hypothetical protein SODALDRAFT_181321 [Sodiomyces alkalinus F11]